MEHEPNAVIAMLQSMTGTKWVIIGVVLLILELITGTTYILWPAAAALLVGLVTFILPLGWEMQFLIFFLVSTALLFFGHKFVRPQMKGGEPSDLNDRARMMIGERVKVIADFDTGTGRVQLGDTQWRAKVEQGTAKAGQELRIMRVDGTTLICEPV